MSSGILQEGRFADAQESRFQAAKRLDMSSVILQEGRFADAQQSRFQDAKDEIWAVLSSHEVDFLILRNGVFRLQKFRKWQGSPARGLIC